MTADEMLLSIHQHLGHEKSFSLSCHVGFEGYHDISLEEFDVLLEVLGYTEAVWAIGEERMVAWSNYDRSRYLNNRVGLVNLEEHRWGARWEYHHWEHYRRDYSGHLHGSYWIPTPKGSRSIFPEAPTGLRDPNGVVPIRRLILT